MPEPTILRPGEGEALGGGTVVVKADTEATDGKLYLAEASIPPGFPGPPLHRHRSMHDMFYVLDGTLTVRVEDDTLELGPGSFACVPPSVAHTFSNPGDDVVRILNLSTPGGFERYMRELMELAQSGGMTTEAMGELLARHDTEVVAP